MVQDYSAKIDDEAERIINDLPRKIAEIMALCEGPMLTDDFLETVRKECKIVDASEIIDQYVDKIAKSATKQVDPSQALTAVKPNELQINFPCNAAIKQIEEKLRPFAEHLTEVSSVLKLWVIVHVPRVEDGHNFGVSVQEEVLNEVSGNIETEVHFAETLQDYYLTRAHMVKRILKYPHIEDYRDSVRMLDEKQFTTLRWQALTYRECYVKMHRKVTLNIDKVRHPRPVSSSNMY